MSSIRFRTTAKGNLPHLSYIFRKPDTLGSEFKTVVCSVIYTFLFIEFHRGEEFLKHSNYHKDLGATAACTKRIMEAKNGIGQKSITGGTKDCFLFDSWFGSKGAAESLMEFGAESVFMVNTNTKAFCKENIEKLTKDWPGGSYLVLKSNPMLPGDRPLIAIGYKYNLRKVLSFIVTDNTGSTNTSILYLYHYLDQFTNVSILKRVRA